MVANSKNRFQGDSQTKGSSPQFSFRDLVIPFNFIVVLFSISFKTEVQPLSTKTILHEILAPGTQTKMVSLIFKR